ncbi:MAG: polyribonucleotide nucleotidyltransferase, partial [Pseudomonadales bacterium]
MNPVTKKFQYGDHEVTLETGKVAKQATGSVVVTMGDTVVLTTVVAAKSARPGQDFFPLTVNYQEKTYAAGKIPGGFFRREGRPSEKETLTCRLIDRPIRPLFPKGFMNEVQVVCTVMSADKDQDPDIASLIGTSAALAISGIPFAGPLGAARVGYKDGTYMLNPGYAKLEESMLNMTVAGTEGAVLMVESEAKELTEDEMLGAVLFAHQEMQVIINTVKELAAEAGKPAWDWQPEPANEALLEQVSAAVKADLAEAYRISDKMERQNRVKELRNQVVEQLATDAEGAPSADEVSDMFGKVEKNLVRNQVIEGSPRIDGRDLKTVRPIHVEVGVLPKTHGSALFTRGETQAVVVATLGTLRDAAMVDALEGTFKDQFMLHYNFPPYSVGEAG